MGVSWHGHYLTPTYGTCEEQFHRKTKNEYPETRNNGFILYANSTLSSKLMQQKKLTLMVNFPVLARFPVYRLTVSQARKTNQKSLLFLYIKILVRIYPEMFVNKWTSGCELTWSLLDTYIWNILRNKSGGKQEKNAEEQENMILQWCHDSLITQISSMAF